jgi:hypothetical protein
MTHSELKAIAEKATPGPWLLNTDFYAGAHYYISAPEWPHLLYVAKDKGARYVNGEFIAAANPSTVLSLIAELDEKTEALKGVVDKYFDIPSEQRLGPKHLKESAESVAARKVLAKWEK